MATKTEYAYNPDHFLAVRAKICLVNYGGKAQ